LVLAFVRTIKNVQYSVNHDLTIVLRSTKELEYWLNCLKYSSIFSFKLLTDLTCEDNSLHNKRFSLSYILTNPILQSRVRLSVKVADKQSVVSASSLFKAANWLEREVSEFFGVYFSGNPDIRRILTDYGFSGNPFRKDFPLSGFEERIFLRTKQAVSYSEVTTSQLFNIKSIV